MECSQCGRRQTVTHWLCGLGLRTHRAAVASETTCNPPPLALHVPGRGLGSGSYPLFLHWASLCHASNICPPHFFDLQRGRVCGGGDKLARLRFHFGGETAHFLDKPGAFAVLPVTRRNEQWTRSMQTDGGVSQGPH